MNPHDPLDDMLRALAAEAPPPLRSVRAEVHLRLRAASSVRGWARWTERIESIFRQPAFATAFVAACLLLGLFLAEVRVSVAKHAQTEAWIQEYARLIDPRRASATAAAPEVSR